MNPLLLLSGVGRIVTRAQMVHVTEAMTERYAGVAIQAKHDALARMERRGRTSKPAALRAVSGFLARTWDAGLFQQVAGASFSSLTSQVGLQEPAKIQALMAFDINRDGPIDLFVGTEGGNRISST